MSRKFLKILAAANVSAAVLAAGTLAILCTETAQKSLVVSALEREGFQASAERISLGIFSREIVAENLQIERDGFSVFAPKISARQTRFLGFLPSRLALEDVQISGIFENASGRENFTLSGSANHARGKTAVESVFSATIPIDNSPARRLDGDAKFEISSETLVLERAEISVGAQSSRLANVRAEQLRFEKNPDGKIALSAGEKPLARAEFRHTPLDAFNPFLRENAFSSGTLDGALELDFSAHENATRSRLEIENATLEKSGSPAMKNISGTFLPRAQFDGKTLELDFAGSELRGEFPKIPGKKFLARAGGKIQISQTEKQLVSAKIDAFENVGKNPPKKLFSAEIGDGGNAILVRTETFPLDLLNTPDGKKPDFSGTLAGTLKVDFPSAGAVKISTTENGAKIANFGIAKRGEKPLFKNLSLDAKEISIVVQRAKNGHSETEITVRDAQLTDAPGDLVAAGNIRLHFLDGLADFSAKISGTLAGIREYSPFAAVAGAGDGKYFFDGKIDAKNFSGKISLRLDGTELKSAAIDFDAPAGGFNNSKDVARARVRIGENSEIRVKFSELSGVCFGKNAGANFAGTALIPLADCEDFARAAAFFSALKTNVPENAKTPTKTPAKTQAGTQNPADSAISKNAPKTAPWKNFSGKIDYKIQELRAPGNVFRNIRGHAKSSENALEITAETDEFFGGKTGAEAKISHDAKAGVFAFDAGAFARKAELPKAVPAIREKSPAPIEGEFDFDLKISSRAETLDALSEKFSADAVLKSSGGHVRIFSGKSKKTKIVGEIAGIGADLAGVFGGLSRKVDPKISRLASGAKELRDYLKDLRYDELRIEASCRADSPVNFGRILLRDELVKFDGAGTLLPIAGKEIGDFPLNVRAKFGAKGVLSELMELLKISAGDAREDGYTPGPEINCSGTLNNPSINFPNLF